MESGKSVERDKIILPIIYNRRNVDIGKIMKDEYLYLQTVMKKPIMAPPVIAYRNNPSLINILVSTLLPTNHVHPATQSNISVLFSVLSFFPNNSKNIGLKTKRY